MRRELSEVFYFYVYGDHRVLHVLTHSCPTRRSSDLLRSIRHGAPDTSQSSQHWAQPIDRSVSGNRSPRPQPTNVLEIAFAGTIVAHASRSTITWRRSRSEEHTSELQSLMRISYAVFCLNKKKTIHYSQ